MMPYEVWGTFSVSDHLRRRPFVADVLLYDKLVIPVVPENDDEVRSRWQERGWQPDDQDKYVETLTDTNRDLVWTVPWDLQKNENFQSRFQVATGVAYDAHNLVTTREVDPDRPAFHVTRMILEDYARDPENRRDIPANVWVDPMAAYPSYNTFAEDVSIRVNPKKPTSTDSCLAGVFGWEFVVPEDPKLSDIELLRVAAELASDSSFRDKRRAFHDWRRRVIKEGITQKAALEEMSTLVQEYNDVVRKARVRTTILNGFTVAGVAVSIAASFAVPVAGLVGAFLAAGRFGAEKWMPGSEPSSDQKAAAMFHDARKQFGWR
jgi:hypothetical protein